MTATYGEQAVEEREVVSAWIFGYVTHNTIKMVMNGLLFSKAPENNMASNPFFGFSSFPTVHILKISLEGAIRP